MAMIYGIKKNIWLTFWIILSFAFTEQLSEAGVLARVKGEDITEEMVLEKFQSPSWLFATGQTPKKLEEVPKKLQKRALKEIIDERVLLPEAKKRGIAITDEEVEYELNFLIGAYGTKEKALKLYQEMLKKPHLTWEDMREKARNDPYLLLQKLHDYIIKQVTVSDEEAESFFAKRAKRLGNKVARFYLYVVNTKEIAQEIQKALREAKEMDGVKLDKINEKFSIINYKRIHRRFHMMLYKSSLDLNEASPYLFRGDTLPDDKKGWVSKPYVYEGNLPFFAKDVFSMEVGDVSGIIKGPREYYYVFKLYSKEKLKKDRPISDRTKERLRENLLIEKRRQAWKKFREQAYEKANVQIFFIEKK